MARTLEIAAARPCGFMLRVRQNSDSEKESILRGLLRKSVPPEHGRSVIFLKRPTISSDAFYLVAL